MASFLIAIIQQNTSNLARLACVLDLRAKPESKYKRLKRFLKDAKIDYEVFAKLSIAILKPSGKYILALERTEWKYGKVWVNILTLSIIAGNTSIPLFWQTLNRKGNSSLMEKRAIIARYIKEFGVENIKYFCADRKARRSRIREIFGGKESSVSVATEGFDADHRQARQADEMRKTASGH